MRKLLYTLFLLCVFTYANAADDKTVTLITSGQGKTQDEAKQSALRNAIEQAFGAFISSHTEVVNDNLVKDEIISVSNGNIKKYEIISESVLPDNLGYTTTLKTIVSISKLTSFCESKGMQIEIKGSLFAFNVIQKELSASNETKALQELILLAKSLAPKMFNFQVTASEPVKNSSGSFNLPIKITTTTNSAFLAFQQQFLKTLLSLSISESEYADFKKINLEVYKFNIETSKKLISGEYQYYSNGRKKVRQEDFDREAFNRGLDFYNDYLGVWAEENNCKEFKHNTFYYRTDIGYILESISGIIKRASVGFSVTDGTNTLIKGESTRTFTMLLQPISFSDNIVGCGKISISNRVDKAFYEHLYQERANFGKREAPIYILNLALDCIVGYTYANIDFSLEEIKYLSKLEVKPNK